MAVQSTQVSLGWWLIGAILECAGLFAAYKLFGLWAAIILALISPMLIDRLRHSQPQQLPALFLEWIAVGVALKLIGLWAFALWAAYGLVIGGIAAARAEMAKHRASRGGQGTLPD